VNGLHVCVEPTGKKKFILRYKGVDNKRSNKTLGNTNYISVTEARKLAAKLLGSILLGVDPFKKPVPILTLQQLIDQHYEPWVLINKKSGVKTLKFLRSSFKDFLNIDIERISLSTLDSWRGKTKNNKPSIKAVTLNRKVVMLRALFNWAVKRKLMTINPIADIEMLKQTDSNDKLRFLSEEEYRRLIATLDAREEKRKRQRQQSDKFTEERGYEQYPRFNGFTDHLKPAVLIALNTGIRQGALFKLKWDDIDFENNIILLRAANAKGQKTQYIPMNQVVRKTLLQWENCSHKKSEYVFPNPKNPALHLTSCKKAWEKVLQDAGIADFRWHDMRHDFASQLIMGGAGLYVVGDLLGHSDIRLTQRYAHLSKDYKQDVVKLIEDR